MGIAGVYHTLLSSQSIVAAWPCSQLRDMESHTLGALLNLRPEPLGQSIRETHGTSERAEGVYIRPWKLGNPKRKQTHTDTRDVISPEHPPHKGDS